ncbi:MAG: radical SAM family heme chaperone HemW [Bacteroidota bacterium]|nr:radical SAM family heme chaperone HemW [Bacteroidota bacterium]
MAGIYLHIPFCRQACHYCNFHFSTTLKRKNDFTDALLKEIALRAAYIDGEEVGTVYFGGGTPSLLEPEALARILDAIRKQFSLSPAAEITLEANPDDVGASALRSWRNLGITRLSLGVQSFYDADLRWMNRAHSAAQSLDAIRSAQDEGFGELSVDLIYGGPTLTDDRWRRNIEQALGLGVPHLSCYALTVEPRTALDHLIRQKKAQPVDPECQARQFLLLMDIMDGAGFEQYEISNFSLPGRRSRHNSSYWKGFPYLGLGPSAHSFNGTSRQWNIADNTKYIGSMESGLPIYEKEDLTIVQRLNEYIMISLRTVEGCDLGWVAGQFGESAAEALAEKAGRYVDSGRMEWRGRLPARDEDGLRGGAEWGSGVRSERVAGLRTSPETRMDKGFRSNENLKGDEGLKSKEGKWEAVRMTLTREGKLLADGIAADLFFDEAALKG